MTSFADRFRIRKPATILSEQDKKMIHEAGLEIMETVGVRVHSAMAKASLKKAGAIVDEKTSVVKFPTALTKSLISKVPKGIVLAGREKEFDLPLDGRHAYFTTDGCGISVWDQKTRSRRQSVLQDIVDTTIISDYLTYLSIYEPMVVAHDVPEKVHVIAAMKEAFRLTQKHITSESTSNPEEARLQIKMASEIVGGIEELRKRHLMSAMVCTMSPLTLDGNATDAAMIWADAKVPIHITGMAMAGISSPATIAGNLVVNHAETLALTAAIQARSPGAPAIYGSVISNMNPKTGAIQLASPESLVLCVAAGEMGHYVNMPSYGGVGSNAKTPGMWSSFENGMVALGNTVFGQEINNGIGMLDCSTVLSYEQMIIDDDIMGRALVAAREVQVNENTLHMDMIKEVGILGMGAKKGNYLSEKATMMEAREFYLSPIFGSEPYDQWVSKGKKDDLTLAKERADWILKNHQPVQLDKTTLGTLTKIVKEASR